MKIITYILTVIAIALIIFNITEIDFNDPLNADSIVAVITVVAGLCTLLLLTILRISKKIETTLKNKS